MSVLAHRWQFSRPIRGVFRDQPIQSQTDDTCEAATSRLARSVSPAHGSRSASARCFHTHLALADTCAVNGQARRLLTRSLA
jgi:hypothetical protein